MHYSYTDANPFNGISYYRLKQTDYDGTFKYSPIEDVRLQIQKMNLQIYPNPVDNEVIIKGSKIELQKIRVFDMVGRDVTQKLQISNGETTTIVDMANMQEGLYIFKINNNAYKVLKK